MHLGRIAAPAALSSAAFLACALALALPACTQQVAAGADAPASPALPARVQAKLDKLQADLKAAQAAGDAKAQTAQLNAIGALYFGASDFEKSLGSYSQALTQARTAKDVEQQTAALNGIGDCYRGQSQNGKAQDAYQEALDMATASGDLRGQATALNGLGWVSSRTGQNQKALEYHTRALPLAQKAKDLDLASAILRRTGVVYGNLGDNQKAMDFYNQALTASRAAGDLADEGAALNNIAWAYYRLGEAQKALDSYSQALPMLRQVGDLADEAAALSGMGVVYWGLGQPQKELEYYNQSLPIRRQVGDRDGEAKDLNNIGLVYTDLGQPQRALDFYNQALPAYRQAGDRNGEAGALGNIAIAYWYLGEAEKALEFFNRAVLIFRETGQREDEARNLGNLGNIYRDLGDPNKALEFFNETLPILRQVGDRNAEANDLNNIGEVYSDLGQPQKALDFYNQAQPIYREVGDRNGESMALDNIGLVYSHLGQPQKALDFYNQALPIRRATGNRDGEAETLNNIGLVFSNLGEKQKALDYLNQALPVATAAHDPLLQASIFRDLMKNQQPEQPALAIFYGKQAVNLVQQVRSNIQGLDEELQKSFLATKDDYYHDLASLLIDQGRLPEAQQVLDLLKQQEYRDYVRGDTANALSPLSLTPAEQQAEADYQTSTAQLVSLGEQWSQLKKIPSRTPEQEKQYRQLSDQLDTANKDLNDYYARLYVLFGNNTEANKQVANVKGNVSVLKDQIADSPHTVALYTMVTPDHYRVIVITASGTVARESAISDKELNKKIADFEQVLRTPTRDPKPLAQDLYNILIGPVKSDLDQAHATTLVWSLDGVLRYLPIAALYDGSHYVVENYNTVTITPASIAHLGEKPDVTNLSAVAMGISRQYENGLQQLPSVVSELNDIVKDPQVRAAHGVISGTILLNNQFTETAMETQLDGAHSVVHIASHFVFKPGDDNQSYLLLAGKDKDSDGFHLTVADFRDNENLSLRHTDLLTLSACETGMSGNASNGREVDGLGTTAQLKGAKAVMSSLWSVNDSSTGLLMGDFYKRWADGAGKVEKVEALRQTQLDLLLGKVTPEGGTGGRGVSLDEPASEAPKGYAHPYYWAPFVLMGNWR